MHSTTSILGPIFALGFWTFIVLNFVGFSRIRAGMKGIVSANDFRLGESENVPDRVRLPNRNYMNLLELPQLFYVACLLIYAIGITSPTTVALSWLYVILRIGHSIVHLSYNNPVHRLWVFAASNTTLLVLWSVAALAVWGKSVA
jgi:hypothetical protein